MDLLAPAKVAPCICGSDDDIGFMICCDGCESWMHGPCVQITKKFSTGIDTYFCPRCLATESALKGQLSAKNITQHSKLLDLSDEVLLWIMSFVRCQRSIGRVSSTCRKLWRIAQDPYLWQHITLVHDASLRRHWAEVLQPKLLLSNIYSLDLQGEIAPPVMIDGLSLERFSGLRVLRLQDVQTYTVYRLASKLPWLHVFEARKIKGGGEIWDWRPFRRMIKLEELLLWRNETSNQAFSLTLDDESLIEIPDDVYPAGEQGGGFVQLSSPSITDLDEEPDSQEDLSDAEFPASMGAPALQLTPISGSSFLPNLRRLALINIVSASVDRGTDSVMRILMRRVEAFVYWNSFNILFPVVRTSFKQLQNLTLIEPSEPAWRDGTWQQHAAAFEGMKQLRTITMINSHISKRFLVPILDALLSLRSLRVIKLISTEDNVENIEAIFNHVLQSSWSGTLDIAIQDDPRDGWASWCTGAKRRADGQTSTKLKTRLFQAERDEVAGLKMLCLKAWQNLKRPPAFIE